MSIWRGEGCSTDLVTVALEGGLALAGLDAPQSDCTVGSGGQEVAPARAKRHAVQPAGVACKRHPANAILCAPNFRCAVVRCRGNRSPVLRKHRGRDRPLVAPQRADASPLRHRPELGRAIEQAHNQAAAVWRCVDRIHPVTLPECPHVGPGFDVPESHRAIGGACRQEPWLAADHLDHRAILQPGRCERHRANEQHLAVEQLQRALAAWATDDWSLAMFVAIGMPAHLRSQSPSQRRDRLEGPNLQLPQLSACQRTPGSDSQVRRRGRRRGQAGHRLAPHDVHDPRRPQLRLSFARACFDSRDFLAHGSPRCNLPGFHVRARGDQRAIGARRT
mmetsp:Transcript_104968/g.321575  ORF Transcript_104968/g.321575 Transcript_104968/m.321575 type:complete len:334 (-) Transcript_104968:554-1555(-)